MYLIITPSGEFKAHQPSEVVEFLQSWFHFEVDIDEINALDKENPFDFLTYVSGDFQISYEDGRALREVEEIPI